jgi:hypothetical protein
MCQTYLNISDILVNLKNKISSQAQNIDLLLVYLALIRNINQNYKFPKTFKFREKTIDFLYFSKYESFEKIIVSQINLITLIKFFDENIIDSDSESKPNSESVSSSEELCNTNSSSEKQETFRYTVFRKNKISKSVFDDYVIKIGSNSIRINSITITKPNFILELDFVINDITDAISKMESYKTYVQTYEISVPVIIKKNIFSREKCLYLQELYEKILEFLCLLNIDIENLFVFSQIDSQQNKTIVSSSLQNIINTLYIRLYELISKIYAKISVSMGDINVNVYYMDENSCVVFFGILNVLGLKIEKHSSNNIKFIEVIFSTQSIKIESLKNKIVPENFSTKLSSLIDNIQIIKTLIELDLKNLSDLIIILKHV